MSYRPNALRPKKQPRRAYQPNAAQVQARAYHRRQRLLNLRCPERGLSRTHTLQIGNQHIPDDLFAGIGQIQQTFHCKIVVKPTTGVGLLWEFSADYSGIACWVQANGVLGVAFGYPQFGFHPVNGSPQFLTGQLQPFTQKTSAENIFATEREVDVVVAIRPASGEIRAWANGVQVICAQTGTEDIAGNDWFNGTAGTYFEQPKNDEVIYWATEKDEPAGIVALSPLSIFACQAPTPFGDCEPDPPFASESTPP